MKKAIVIILITLSLIGSFLFYVNFKKETVTNEVRDFLIKEEGIKEENIINLTPIIANLPGDKNYLVFVELKNDEKKYYYYKDNNQVLLHSYSLNGEEHVIN